MNINWIVDGVLAQSPYPYPEDLKHIYDEGIRAIVSLESHPYSDLIQEMGFDHLQVYIRDFTAPKIHQYITINKFIDNMENLEKPVLVHCFQAGRSGTVCAGYLIHKGMTSNAAIMEVRRKIRNPFITAIETIEQKRSLEDFEAAIKKPTVVGWIHKWPKEKLMNGMRGIYRRIK